jgi:hypothetical protein
MMAAMNEIDGMGSEAEKHFAGSEQNCIFVIGIII